MPTVSFIPGPASGRNRQFDLLASSAPGVDFERVQRGAKPTAGAVLVLGQGATLPGFTAADAPGFIQLLECSNDSVDHQKLRAYGTRVAGVSEALADSVASFTVAIMIAGLRIAASGAQRSRVDVIKLLAQSKGDDPFKGKQVGVIGFGRVGQAVSRKLKRAGAEVVYCDVRTAPAQAVEELGVRRVTLDRLLTTSDAISIHVLHGPTSDRLVRARELGLVKTRAVIVNTSHHLIVDNRALTVALDASRLGAAVLDCPNMAGDPDVAALGKVTNAIVTPGIATSVPGDDQAAAEFALSNVDAALAGREIRSLIEILDVHKLGDPAFWSSAMSARQGPAQQGPG